MDEDEAEFTVEVKLPAGPFSWACIVICRLVRAVPHEVLEALLQDQRQRLEGRQGRVH